MKLGRNENLRRVVSFSAFSLIKTCTLPETSFLPHGWSASSVQSSPKATCCHATQCEGREWYPSHFDDNSPLNWHSPHRPALTTFFFNCRERKENEVHLLWLDVSVDDSGVTVRRIALMTHTSNNNDSKSLSVRLWLTRLPRRVSIVLSILWILGIESSMFNKLDIMLN